MDDWAGRLYRELDEWNFAGVAASMWWRDDDAQAPSAALDRALELAQKYHAPLALAVIPHGLDDALAARLETAEVCVSPARTPRPGRWSRTCARGGWAKWMTRSRPGC